MIYPTIHNNGTSADELISRLIEAYENYNTALTALRRTTPNARDYPNDISDYDFAISEHNNRVNNIRSAMRELMDIISNIQHQTEINH